MRALALSILVFLAFTPCAFALSAPARATEELKILTASGDALLFNVELAKTPEEQRKGLMFRKYLAEDSGMLFVFSEEKTHSFWMKNTLIPLDMLFIDKTGIILHIQHDAIPHDLRGNSSVFPVNAVLEINGGIAYKKGIAVGDRVIHKVFLAD